MYKRSDSAIWHNNSPNKIAIIKSATTILCQANPFATVVLHKKIQESKYCSLVLQSVAPI